MSNEEPQPTQNSIYDLVDDIIRSMGRQISEFGGLSQLTGAYDIADRLGVDSTPNSELSERIESAGRMAWDAIAVAASIGLRFAGPPGAVLKDGLLRASEGPDLAPNVIDIGDVHVDSDSESHIASIPIRVINRSFYEEGRVEYCCSPFIGPGPLNQEVAETTLPARVEFVPSYERSVDPQQELVTNMTLHIEEHAHPGHYKALVQALPLDSWTVVKLRIR